MRIPRSIGSGLAVAILGLLVLAFGLVVFGLVRARTNQSANMTRIEAENRALRARAKELERNASLFHLELPAEPGPVRPETERGQKSPVNAVEQAKLLIQFREQLAAANRSVEGLQLRIQQLQYTIEKMTEENKTLAASESELKEKAAATDRVLHAFEAETKTKEDRLAQLESNNRKLREDNLASDEKSRQTARLLHDLEEINRRREAYLNTVLRRYRDVTDQYRGLSARLDRENSGPGASELGAIQNAISMAEEDLHQLSSLNAQASHIQQKIAAK
jgi:chromosome segregation ATPase